MAIAIEENIFLLIYVIFLRIFVKRSCDLSRLQPFSQPKKIRIFWFFLFSKNLKKKSVINHEKIKKKID